MASSMASIMGGASRAEGHRRRHHGRHHRRHADVAGAQVLGDPLVVEHHAVEVLPDAPVVGAVVLAADPGPVGVDRAAEGPGLVVHAHAAGVVADDVGVADVPPHRPGVDLLGAEHEPQPAADRLAHRHPRGAVDRGLDFRPGRVGAQGDGRPADGRGGRRLLLDGLVVRRDRRRRTRAASISSPVTSPFAARTSSIPPRRASARPRRWAPRCITARVNMLPRSTWRSSSATSLSGRPHQISPCAWRRPPRATGCGAAAGM